MAVNSVLAGVIVARFLGAESLGVLVVLNITIATTIHLSSFGLQTANTYFTARDGENLAPAFINSLVFAVISGGLCAVAVLIFSPLLMPGVPPELALAGLLSIPFHLVTMIVTNLFLARAQVKRFNLLDFLNQSFVLTNALIAVLLLDSGLWLLVSLNTAASIAVCLLTVFLFYRYLAADSAKSKWSSDFALLRRMLTYAVKGHILWAAMMIMLRVDVIIVNSFRGPVEAAVYGVALQYTMLLALLPNVVANLMLQRVAASPEEAAGFTSMAARNSSLILFVACVLSIPLAMMLPLVYGPAFAETPFLVWLLLPGAFLGGVHLALVQYFVGTGLPRMIPGLWVATLVLNVAANLLLVPVFGSVGAALVSSFCYALIFSAVYVCFWQRTGYRLTDVLICTRDDVGRLLAFAGLGKAI